MRVICFERPVEENGYMNSWYEAPFYAEGRRFWCAEQYVLYKKSLMFADEYHANKIAESKEKTEIIKYAKDIKGYVDKVWNARRVAVVYRANLYKFRQNLELKQALLETGETPIALLGKTDKIWGIGLNKDDTRIYNMSKWDGLNLLGFALMEVRDTLKSED